MGLNGIDEMQKTKIEWVKNPDGSQGYSWNPIRGKCPVACKLPDGRIYCYGHRHYDMRPWLEEGTGSGLGCLMNHEIEQPVNRKKPTGIFVCSLFELFYPDIEWYRNVIFHTISQCPQHRFYILTKLPHKIDRPMPDNVWLGVSITGLDDVWKLMHLKKAEAKFKFISHEPILEEIEMNDFKLMNWADWLIVGRLSHHGRKYDPKPQYIMDLAYFALCYQVPFFMKNNLKEIWGCKLRQEMPVGK